MTDLQTAKAVTRAYMADFDKSAPADRLTVLQAHSADTYAWRGLHPFNSQDSAKAAISAFWTPYLSAFTNVQRREVIFFAGLNDCDGQTSTWTCSMGHFMGLFDKPWLGIPATRKTTFLRYAEYHRIENGKIAETALFFDILGVMQQAGCFPLPPQTGADHLVPGPLTNDGQLTGKFDPAIGEKTLAIVNGMAAAISAVNVAMNDPDGKPPTPQDELREHWHEDMAWYGPAGIGSTYTIERYAEQHQQPFRKQLANRKFNGHVARFAEGNYCGFFGWPNLTLTPTGGYMGMPASNKPVDMRVTDIYRRDGDKLAENWVIIDMLHFLNMQGYDVLARLKELSPS